MQRADEVARRNDVGHRAYDGRHAVDLEDEAGQHDRRQEGGVQRHHRRVELVAGEGGDQQAHAEGAGEEQAADQQQDRQRTAIGYAEHPDRHRHAQRHGDHAEEVIRDQLGEQQLAARHLGGEQGFHGAALPFAGDHQRGENGADHRHDDGDGAGNDVVPADGRRVEPVAHLHVNQRLVVAPPIGGALLLPNLPYALGIALHEVGGVRLAAVGDHLDGGAVVRARHALVEIHRDHHQAADHAGLHLLDQLPAVVADGRFDIGRTGERLGQIARVFALLLHQNAQMQLAGVQVDAVAEDKQQHQRDNEGDQAAAGIAQYLPRLLQAQRAQSAPGEAAVVDWGSVVAHRGSSSS